MQFIVITAEGTETYDGSYEVEDCGVLIMSWFGED